MEKTFKLIAQKSFLGQPGESRRPNGHVLPGDVVLTNKQRRQALLSRNLAADAPTAPAAKNRPAPGNKMADPAENKAAPAGKSKSKAKQKSAGPAGEGKSELPLESGPAQLS